MLMTILVVVIILVLLGGVGTAPVWNHSANYGYGPSGGISLVGLIIIIVLILLLTGHL